MDKQEILSVMNCCSKAEINDLKLETAIAWIKCMQKGRSPIDRLMETGIEEMIVYGMAEFGELLVEEAKRKRYKVFGITDRAVHMGEYRYQDIPVLKRDEIQRYQEKTIVVTSMTFWKEIEEELIREGHENIVALRELL